MVVVANQTYHSHGKLVATLNIEYWDRNLSLTGAFILFGWLTCL